MAKKQSASDDGKETTAGYFRNIFKEKPRLLGERSNDPLLKQWLADHPDHSEVPESVKAGLSNVKSVLRSKRRRRGRPKQDTAAAAVEMQVVAATPAKAPRKSSKLEHLEQHIDECLIEARLLDKEGLADVINYLRRARNAVVWKIGQ